MTSTMPLLAHLEDAHLGGGAEAVLHRAQQAVGLEAVAFQVEHGIDDVLQHARPGDDAFLGDVPDDEDRHPGGFGQLAQAAGALAHLRDRPGRGVHLGDVDGLDRVDDEQLGLHGADVLEDGVEVGLGDQVELGRAAGCSCSRRAARILIWRSDSSPETYSTLRCGGHLQGHLQHQGGFADAGVAADQDDRAGHDAAAQDAGELADGDGDAAFAVALDLIQAARAR